MTYPSFSAGDVLNASDMNAVGLWRVTGCTVTSAGGTAATASNGVITIGTGNTSVTVSNAFSADYDNYRIVISGGSGSGTNNVQFNFVGSTGNTYYTAGNFVQFTVATNNAYAPGVTNFTVVGFTSTNDYAISMDLYGPNKARRKFLSSNSSSFYGFTAFAGIDTDTTARTGFVLTCSGAGTMTGGQIRVYGYRN